MGELRNEQYGITDQVMLLYDLIPVETKEVPPHGANFNEWLGKVRPALEKKLVESGIHLSDVEKAILDIKLYDKYLENA